jgi:hypothetical protein
MNANFHGWGRKGFVTPTFVTANLWFDVSRRPWTAWWLKILLNRFVPVRGYYLIVGGALTPQKSFV